MINHPEAGNTVYEVTLYNKEVRAAIKENRSHALFGDHWADKQVHGICARTEDEARSLITEKFAPEHGFVIQAIRASSVPAGL